MNYMHYADKSHDFSSQECFDGLISTRLHIMLKDREMIKRVLGPKEDTFERGKKDFASDEK